MATMGIDDNRFNEIIDEIAIINKCENCGAEIEEGAVLNYCPDCFKEYVEKIEKERVK